MTIVHDDDDIVVVDKPVGVAAHPSVGWTGPTVLGGLAAAGYRISTSGASERQGVVSRLVGTSGLMVVCKSERAYSVLKRAFKHRAVDKTYHALVQNLPDPLVGTIDAPIGRHPGADYKFAVLDSGRNAVTRTTRWSRRSGTRASLLEIHLETGRTRRSGCTSRRCTIRAAATSPTAPTLVSPRGSGWSASGCTRRGWGSSIRPGTCGSPTGRVPSGSSRSRRDLVRLRGPRTGSSGQNPGMPFASAPPSSLAPDAQRGHHQRPEAEPVVGHHRRAHDESAPWGVPAGAVLFPFMAPTENKRRRPRQAWPGRSSVPEFTATFGSTAWFEDRSVAGAGPGRAVPGADDVGGGRVPGAPAVRRRRTTRSSRTSQWGRTRPSRRCGRSSGRSSRRCRSRNG